MFWCQDAKDIRLSNRAKVQRTITICARTRQTDGPTNGRTSWH